MWWGCSSEAEATKVALLHCPLAPHGPATLSLSMAFDADSRSDVGHVVTHLPHQDTGSFGCLRSPLTLCLRRTSG